MTDVVGNVHLNLGETSTSSSTYRGKTQGQVSEAHGKQADFLRNTEKAITLNKISQQIKAPHMQN